MTNLQSTISYIRSRLEPAYPADEAEALAWWLVEEETGLSRTQLQFGHKDTAFSPNMQKNLERLLLFEPIQYIFGHTLWCGLDLKVTPATLIPRPETAELVERISNNFKQFQTTSNNFKLLDIGTGSGCIAIALKKRHPEWQVTGIDISAEAIEVAGENARRNNVEVEFLQCDIFSPQIENGSLSLGTSSLGTSSLGTWSLDPCFDFVVSNPPYICEREKASMRENVLAFEPPTALFVPDNDPLLFYRRIASLRLGRRLFFEINETFPDEIEALLTEYGYTNIHLTRDIYGKPRIIDSELSR